VPVLIGVAFAPRTNCTEHGVRIMHAADRRPTARIPH
jgi:hypothetical protein